MAQQYDPSIVVQEALLKSLDPENKNVIVTKQDLYGDGINVWEIKKYSVQNTRNKMVFEFTSETLESSFRKTLKIKDITVSFDTKDSLFNCGALGNFANFVRTLEEALKQKLRAQAYVKAYKTAKKSISLKDSIIIKHLQNTL